MTQFRVLPVRRGDAFLLESARGDYLVDGGVSGCGLPDMLRDRKVSKLRAVIVTGTSAERLGGVIDLLRSERRFNELWLPEAVEIMAESARRFEGDWKTFLGLVLHGRKKGRSAGEEWPLNFPMPAEVGERRLAGAVSLLALGTCVVLGRPPVFSDTESSRSPRFCLESMVSILARRALALSEEGSGLGQPLSSLGWRILQSGRSSELAVLCGRLLHAEAKVLPGTAQRGARPLVQGLALVAQVAALASDSSSRLRFFRQDNRLTNYLVPRHPFRCVNGGEVDPLESMGNRIFPESLVKTAKQIASLNRTLVFQYGDRGCSALFCSDTRLGFLTMNQNIRLDRPTVVTAPRQGRCASENVYDLIRSRSPQKDVWVRTHISNSQKISDEYKQRMNKLCLSNCTNQVVQEVLLRFMNGRWTPNPDVCACG